jgi:hypothetical protein
MDYENLIKKAYGNFNNRNIDTVFETMNTDVHWPNGWEGGYLEGFDAVRDYWTRQWSAINPNVEPTGFKALGDDVLEVEVHQTVKDLEGNPIFDAHLKHIYRFENGLIKSMEIEKEAV